MTLVTHKIRDLVDSLTTAGSSTSHGRLQTTGPVSVALIAEPEALEWCEHYLAPSVVSSPLEGATGIDLVIRAVHDETAWHRLASLLDAGEPTESHTYNKTPIREWAFGDGLWVQQYVARQSFTVIDVESSVITFVDDCLHDHEWWMEPSRLVRESITRRLEEHSTFVFHAGSISLEGRGAVFIGPKRAGKTTLTVASLEHAGAGFIANDRAYVSMPSGRPCVTGWPVTAALGIGTCLGSPVLRSLVERGVGSRYPQPALETRVDLEEFRGRDVSAKMHERVKIELTPLEMGKVFEVPVVAREALDAVVFPELDPTCDQPELRRLTVTDAAERLREQILTCDAAEYPDWLHLRRPSDEETHNRVGAFVDLLLDAVPSFALRYWDPALAATALRRCLLSTLGRSVATTPASTPVGAAHPPRRQGAGPDTIGDMEVPDENHAEDVRSRVRGVLEEVLGQAPAGDDQALQDLGVDSLLIIEVAVALESEFSIAIPDEDLHWSNMETVGHLDRIVAAALGQGMGSIR